MHERIEFRYVPDYEKWAEFEEPPCDCVPIWANGIRSDSLRHLPMGMGKATSCPLFGTLRG
jgi:hypothetical protein